MKKRILVSVVAMLLVLAISASAMAGTRWIKTKNGKPAAGREGPSAKTTLITSIKYGTEVVTVGSSQNGYTPVQLPGGSDTVYVLTKFLVKSKPGKYVPTTKPSSDSDKSGSGMQSAIVSEFNAAKFVTPYNVTTYNKRSGGVVNMRWAPNEKAKLINTYPIGQTMIVMAELKNWYQVQDPELGWVGFIRKDLLQK